MTAPVAGLLAVQDGWEYWRLGSEVYRVRADNRGYMLPDGIPANTRWECSMGQYERFLAPARH
jgi:hypothetical protein